MSKSRAVDFAYVGQALVRLNRPDEALPHLRRARALFDASDDPWLAADTMDWEAGALYLKEDPTALAVTAEALRRYRRLSPRLPGTEARMLEHMGQVLARNRAHERAYLYFEEAIRVAGTIQDPARRGRIYHGLASCYQQFGDSSQAMELAQRALAHYSVEQDQPLIARGENELGLALMQLGQLDRAEQHIQAAINHLNSASVEWGRSHYVLSLAELWTRQDRIDDAFDLVSAALELASRLGEVLAVITGHRQLGELHARRRDHDLADANFGHALRRASLSGLRERRAEVLTAYANVRATRRRSR